MTKIDEKIELKKRQLKQLMEKKQQVELEKKRKAKKNSRPRGRPQLEKDLLEKARKMAETRTLPETAFRLGISRSTLYKKGISRKNINAEKQLEQLEQSLIEEIEDA